jgi:uncharacterized protein (DUF1330 family)
MPKGYVVVTEAIRDPEGMNAYGKTSTPSLGEQGATVLGVDERVEVLEGEWHGNRTVILEFGSVEEARRWYASATYQAAVPLRQAAADSNVAIISGL